MPHARRTIAIAAAIVMLFVLIGGARGTSGTAQTIAPAGAAPEFRVDPSWPTIPNGWIFGQASNVAVDKRDHVWVLQRPDTRPICGGLTKEMRPHAAPPVLEFDSTGKFIRGWGGQAQVGTNGGVPYDWPWCEHGIFVDDKDFVWIAGRGDSQPGSDDAILKFTRTGRFVMQIGTRGLSKGNTDTANLNSPADMFVYSKTNEIFVADGYGNRRVIVFDATTGAYKRMWGAFGNPPTDPAPGEKDPPDTAESFAGRGPQQFIRPVHGIAVSNDGLVYVADRGGKRVQVFTLEGKYTDQVFVDRDCHAPACGSGHTAVGVVLSPDPQQRFIHVGSRSTGRIWTIDRKTLQPLGHFGTFGKARGEFDTLHGMAIDSKGNIYTAEVRTPGRVQKFIRADGGK